MLGVFVVGLRWGTFAVGGSDSSCYVLQATRWAAFDLQPPQPLALEAPWPNATSTFAVSGHVASTTVGGAMVPICAAGLSVLMAAFLQLGGPQAVFFVVPLFGALLVGAAYVLGERVSVRVGVAAAALTAASPVFLFQVVQPMSDVPAAALWSTAVALAMTGAPRRSLLAGLVTSLAILVRPNLLPLGLTIGVALLLRPGRPARVRWGDAAAYAAGSAPGCLVVALVQQYFYGSPFSSGYGAADALFAFSNMEPNLRRYAGWLWETQTPICVLALLTPVVYRRWTVALLAALIVVNLLCYLPYVVFEEWSYLRFLLPTLPFVIVLSAMGLDWCLVRICQAMRVWTSQRQLSAVRVGLAVATAALMAVMVRTAVDRSAFALSALESRYVRAGMFVAQRLPENAVVLTSFDSGSVSYYSGRQTVAWDALEPAWLDRAIDYLRRRGFQPVVLIESWEESGFRRRFAGSQVALLDWPPAAEIRGQVRIYRPEDRARYQAGEQVRTEYAR